MNIIASLYYQFQTCQNLFKFCLTLSKHPVPVLSKIGQIRWKFFHTCLNWFIHTWSNIDANLFKNVQTCLSLINTCKKLFKLV